MLKCRSVLQGNKGAGVCFKAIKVATYFRLCCNLSCMPLLVVHRCAQSAPLYHLPSLSASHLSANAPPFSGSHTRVDKPGGVLGGVQDAAGGLEQQKRPRK
jgi:hypothetical protein